MTNQKALGPGDHLMTPTFVNNEEQHGIILAASANYFADAIPGITHLAAEHIAARALERLIYESYAPASQEKLLDEAANSLALLSSELISHDQREAAKALVVTNVRHLEQTKQRMLGKPMEAIPIGRAIACMALAITEAVPEAEIPLGQALAVAETAYIGRHPSGHSLDKAS